MNKIKEKLTHFYSIGPVQAKKLLDRLLELKLIDLEKAKKDEYTNSDLRRILSKQAIFDELSVATQTDLTYNPLRVIPRPIVQLIHDELHRIFDPKKIRFDIAGSFIRGKPTSGDIDMVLINGKTWDYYKDLVNQSSNLIKFHEPFAQGNDKVAFLIEVDLNKSGLLKQYPEFKTMFKCSPDCKVNVKMDVFLSNENDYVFAMLFAIGSGLFNIRMRATAKRKGFLLNHHGLFKKNKNSLTKIPLKTEKDIFSKLNITYLEPKDRIK